MQKFWHQFIRKTNLHGPSHRLGLEYGMMIALSASMVTLAWHCNTLFPNFLLTVLSASLSVFFSYGKFLWQRIISLTIGCAYMIAINLIAHALIQSPTLIALYMLLIVFISYYLSAINSMALFVCKLSVTFLAFILFPSVNTAGITVHNLAMSMAEGGLFGLVSIIIVHPILTYIDSKNRAINACLKVLCHIINTPIRNWEDNQIKFLVTKAEQLHADIPTSHLNTIHIINATQALKSVHVFFTGEQAWLFEKGFQHDVTKLLKQIHHGISSLDQRAIESAYNNFKHSMDKKKDSLELQSIDTDERLNILLCLFHFHKLTSSIIKFINHYRDSDKFSIWGQQTCSNINPWPALSKPDLNFLKKDNTNKIELSCTTKIAIRATVALGLSYLVASLLSLKFGAWVFLTTNIVLLNRPGVTIQRSWQRISGHLAGFFVGIPLGFLWHYHSWPYLWVPALIFFCGYAFIKNYFIFSLGIMILTLYLYNQLSPAPLTGLESIYFMSYRLLDTLVGAIIAVLTCLYIFPIISVNSTQSALNQLCLALSKSCKDLAALLMGEDKTSLDDFFNGIECANDRKLHADVEIQELHFQPSRLKTQYRYFNNIFVKETSLLLHLEELGMIYCLLEQSHPSLRTPEGIAPLFLTMSEQLQLAQESQNESFKLISEPEQYQQWMKNIITMRDNNQLEFEETVSYIAFINMINTTRSDVNLLLSSFA